MIVESNGSCLPSAPAVVVMMGGDAEMAELVVGDTESEKHWEDEGTEERGVQGSTKLWQMEDERPPWRSASRHRRELGVLLSVLRVEEATVVQMPAIETRIDKNYSGPGLSA
ncbi:hypothetical protein G5I_14002 [Acromyrmex echinatior]|uniref:Uncharacterized protein n=1 Tax=Acromyrmex echinatior TaxID=103372 RepID=F4X6N4_ACREC|nr:hypothetical protein G5I_14002 [Acromyrmex echinatior]